MYSRSILFKVQVVLQLLMTAVFFLFQIGLEAQAILCGILLCTVGIPHGANDHLYRKDKSSIGMCKFLGVYLGTMMLYCGIWWFTPALALVLFFVMSFHHFGQSNFENDSVWHLPSLLWGTWILVFPVVLHFREALEIFESMIGLNQEQRLSTQIINSSFTEVQIISLSALLILYVVSLLRFERQSIVSYLVQFTVVTIWYLTTPLLVGFIVIFCLWHAMQSLRHQANYFRQSMKGSVVEFVKAMLPFSSLALVTFGVYVYFRGFNIAEAFILLSLITLPHVLVMHRLYGKAKGESEFSKAHS